MDAWEVWLVQKLPILATLFGFDNDSAEVEFIAAEALFAAGLDDISELEAADEPMFRAALVVEAWLWIAAAVAGDYDFSADGGRYSRSQLSKHADRELGRATAAAIAAGVPAYALPDIELGYLEMT